MTDAQYRCCRCRHEYADEPGWTTCPACSHEYVEWTNYAEWREMHPDPTAKPGGLRTEMSEHTRRRERFAALGINIDSTDEPCQKPDLRVLSSLWDVVGQEDRELWRGP